MSIAVPHGPIATAYAVALRWAHSAEEHRCPPALRSRLWGRVVSLHRIMGERYIVHPMDPWDSHRSVVGLHANRFRRRFFALPKEQRDKEMHPDRWSSWAWQYLTWPPPEGPINAGTARKGERQ